MHKLIHKTCESIITPPKGDDRLDKSRLRLDYSTS
ncbi:MAG: hypothetical protein K0S94_1768 [Nitrospira sp.]|jgi:hypothetical protein|nr:hypothetical protein [Nitrospira sp.]